MKKALALFLTLTLAATAAHAEKYYQKTLTFPAGATAEQKVKMAACLVPNKRQLAWQQRELTAFLHFGMNTFTGREWGDGKEDPALFNPKNLDADQWVSELRDAGFKMVILTAKHHDGFCLWPTKTTKHSVASSPWKDGKGDVVADLRRACDKYGMKLGLYLSPWDRNAECYGDSPRYNDMFVAQLTELLSNYGHIDEVWFDGACGEGPNGKKQVYDWQRFRATMEKLQPDAVLAITGDDVRWVGNEGGQGRETEWSATVLTPAIYPGSDEANDKIGVGAMAKDLGSRELVAKADKLHWWPSEVDVSIRPGWFFHATEKPKSLAKLAEIYLNSVGRNSVLLLNIPPDTDGLIHANDADRIYELHQWVLSNFTRNLVTEQAGDEYQMLCAAPVNCVELCEDINRGQRVEQFTIEGRVDGEWQPIASGTTIGYKRILTFPQVKVDRLRLVINSSRAKANIKSLRAFRITMPEEEAIDPAAYNIIVCNKADITATAMEMVYDLGTGLKLAGFTYTPAADARGTVFHYALMASNDGDTWQEVPTTGEFSNIVNNPIEQNIHFGKPVNARYIKLVAKELTDDATQPTGTLKVFTSK